MRGIVNVLNNKCFMPRLGGAFLELSMNRKTHLNSLSQERGEGYIAGIAAMGADDKPGTPSAETVHAFLRRHDISGSKAARMMYLSGSNQVRKYTGGKSPRQMDAARWFCLHAHVLLSADQIADIESAMDEDMNYTATGALV